MSEFLPAVWAIVWKDLRVEGRTRQTISIMVMFSLAMVIMFNFALGMAINVNITAGKAASPALLWLVTLLAAVLGLNRSLALDRENQVIDAILMAPIPRGALYLGKVISITLFTLALDLILVVLFTAFFGKPFYLPVAMLVLALGTIGYISAGVLITSITIQSRARDVLLPVLLLPLSLPLVLPASMATTSYIASAALGEATWELVRAPVLLVIAYDLMMLAVGFLTYRYVVES